MQITEIHVHKVRPRRGLIAFVNIVVDDSLFLGSIAVHEKKDGSGYRLTYPTKNDSYLFHPTRRHLSREIEQAIINEVKTVIGDPNHAGHGSATNTT